MSVYALITFLALPFLSEVLTGRDFLLLVNVQILTAVTFLTLPVQPVHTDSALTLRFIHSLILRLNDC